MVNDDEMHPRDEDFCFGKGAPNYSAGKEFMKNYVRENGAAYVAARGRDEKRQMITQAITALRDFGGHFKKIQPGGTYQIVDTDKQGRKKMADLFYENNKRSEAGEARTRRLLLFSVPRYGREPPEAIKICPQPKAITASPSGNDMQTVVSMKEECASRDDSFLEELSGGRLSFTPSVKSMLKDTSLSGTGTPDLTDHQPIAIPDGNCKRYRSGRTVHSSEPQTKYFRHKPRLSESVKNPVASDHVKSLSTLELGAMLAESSISSLTTKSNALSENGSANCAIVGDLPIRGKEELAPAVVRRLGKSPGPASWTGTVIKQTTKTRKVLEQP